MAVVYLQRCLLCRRRAVKRWGDWYVCRDHYDALERLREARARAEMSGAIGGKSGVPLCASKHFDGRYKKG